MLGYFRTQVGLHTASTGSVVNTRKEETGWCRQRRTTAAAGLNSAPCHVGWYANLGGSHTLKGFAVDPPYCHYFIFLSSMTTNLSYTWTFRCFVLFCILLIGWMQIGRYFFMLVIHFSYDVCSAIVWKKKKHVGVFTRLKMWFLSGSWTTAALRTIWVDVQLIWRRGDLLPRCQMGKIKYRHETGRHPGNKRNTAGVESESSPEPSEKYYFHTFF